MARDPAAVTLVLASASPRRMALLEQAGLAPHLLCPTDVDESPLRNEAPRRLALRLASAKAEAARLQPSVSGLAHDVYILGADTVVALGRRILPKAEDPETAQDCLELLSGRSHRVYTAVCLIAPGGKRHTRIVETRVRFKRMTRIDMDSYLACEEWRGKAGGYAIQGRAEAFVRLISGSWSNVVGLPLHETVNLLQGAGYPVHLAWLDGQKG
jgi:septum formation protein